MSSNNFILSVINGWNTPIANIKLTFVSDGKPQQPDIPNKLGIGEAVGVPLVKYDGSDRYTFSFSDGQTTWTTSSNVKIFLNQSGGVALLKPDAGQLAVLTWSQDGNNKETASLSKS
jgi:hypothetical protein